MPSIPYSSRIFPSITRLFPCLNQPGLEQRREAVLFKTARLTDFHLAEQGRRWSDVVRHAGAVRKDGTPVGSHSGTDGRPGFFQTSRRGYLVRIRHCYLHSEKEKEIGREAHIVPSGQQHHDENRIQERSFFSEGRTSICIATRRLSKVVCDSA